jgi:hypothetical protein
MPVSCSKDFQLTVTACTYHPVYDIDITNHCSHALYMIVPIVYAPMKWWQGDWLAYQPSFPVGETRHYVVTPSYFPCGIETTICTGKEMGSGLFQVWGCLLCSQVTFWPSPYIHFQGDIVESTDAECNMIGYGAGSGYRTNWTF